MTNSPSVDLMGQLRSHRSKVGAITPVFDEVVKRDDRTSSVTKRCLVNANADPVDLAIYAIGLRLCTNPADTYDRVEFMITNCPHAVVNTEVA